MGIKRKTENRRDETTLEQLEMTLKVNVETQCADNK